ncbi:MAG: hypothetical protein OEZ43_19050 [Gammaproteobacteria bacterium]|nr:hypothetical protein [Gammaproteobacteria bacterium]
MKEFRLGPIALFDHEDGIVEGIVDEGATVSGQTLSEMMHLLADLPSKPRGFMVNRKNSYAMDFSAFPALRHNKVIEVVAIVNNGRQSQMIIQRFWPKFLKLAFFDVRDEAYAWLHARLQGGPVKKQM